MQNLSMKRKLESGECLDVRKEGVQIGIGMFKLRRFVEDVDYCDATNEDWIWSVGRSRSNGEILAATSAVLYQNSDFECLFLR